MISLPLILLAAGKGNRFRGGDTVSDVDNKNVKNKVYEEYKGTPLILHSLNTFLSHPLIDKIVLVVDQSFNSDALFCHPEQSEGSSKQSNILDLFSRFFTAFRMTENEFCHPEFISGSNPKLIIVSGGARRQDSVKCGLDALSKINQKYPISHVLIHDGARPNVTHELITRVINNLSNYDCVIPAISVVDTIKEVDENGLAIKTHKRSSLKAIQTPQGFNYKILCDLLSKYDDDITDEAYLFEAFGYKVKIVDGCINNKKITYRADLD